MLCGTPEEVAEGAARFNAAGMDTPIIQPVVQEDNQIQLALQAAALYGSLAVREKVVSGERPAAIGSVLAPDEKRLSVAESAWRKFSAWVEIARPFSFTASSVPVMAAGALALTQSKFDLIPSCWRWSRRCCCTWARI